jgi:hypothetical protein
MEKWGASINHDFQSTGEIYTALVGPRAGKDGEKVLALSWGGIVLKFDDGEKITYSIGDVRVKSLNA